MYMESNRFYLELFCYPSDLGNLIAEIDRITDGYINDRFSVQRLTDGRVIIFDSEVKQFCGHALGNPENYSVLTFPSRCLGDCLSFVSSLSNAIGINDVTNHSFFIRVLEFDPDSASEAITVAIIKL